MPFDMDLQLDDVTPLTDASWFFGAIGAGDDAEPDGFEALQVFTYIASKLSAVAVSGAYADLTGKPSLAAVATSGAYADLTGKPSLATVATTGLFADLLSKPNTLAGYGIGDAYTQSQVNSALALKADLASPALTGNPTVPTQAPGNSSTRASSTEFVMTAIGTLMGAAPAALDTLAELAAAFNNDPDIIATLTTSIADKLAKASNLSDLVDASAARGNLGLVIGTNVQAWSANLDGWSAIATATKQAAHANLTAFAGLSLVADKLPYANGTGTLALADFSSFGRQIANLVDAAAARTLFVVPTGTSGAVLGFLNANNTVSGAWAFSGNNTFSGLNSFAQGSLASSAAMLFEQAWASTGTYSGWEFNFADNGPANAASVPFRVRRSGTDVLALTKFGNLTLGDNTQTSLSLTFNLSGSFEGVITAASSNFITIGQSGLGAMSFGAASNGGLYLPSTLPLCFSSASGGNTTFSAGWYRLAAGDIQQGQSMASPVAQVYRAGGSRAGTDSNVGGANITFAAGLGTGSGAFSTLFLASPGVVGGAATTVQTLLNGLAIRAGAAVLTSYTVATLPLAATAGVGATAFVTDSNATLAAGHGNIVAGGGSDVVPVYSDGTNWRIG